MSAAAEVSERDDPRPRVLVVEDDPDLRELLVAILEGEGLVVEGAAQGVQALERLAADAPLPAAVVLDLLMPLMDGREFLRRKSVRPEWSLIPVVVLSGARDLEHAGPWTPDVRAVLAKPTSAHQLIDTLRTVYREPRHGH
jgi:CheY-like chemotaxis protein